MKTLRYIWYTILGFDKAAAARAEQEIARQVQREQTLTARRLELNARNRVWRSRREARRLTAVARNQGLIE